MGERVGDDATLRFALEPVIPYGARGSESFFDVACLEDASLPGVVRPDSGEEVGLEFEAHGKLVGLGFPYPSLRRVHPVHRAQEVLNVMTDLVREDICLSKVSWSAEPRLQLPIEGQVDVKLLITRTVERPDG